MKKALVFILALLMLFTIAACGGKQARPEWSEYIELENIEFRGVDANSSPLAATGLKLLQRERESSSGMEYEYTIVGTLSKTSSDPDEGFFSFDVILIDEFGRHIETESVDTMPGPFSPRHNNKLLSNGDTHHLEEEIRAWRDESQPVAVEFASIKESNKDAFIRITLDEAIDRISKDQLDGAKKYCNLVLEYDPNNAEAKALLEQIKELEENESASAPEPEPEPEPEQASTSPDEDQADESTDEPVVSDVDWKEFLKLYEEWIDSYIEFMEKYNANPTDVTLLNDYLKLMQEISEWAEMAEQIEVDLANDPVALKEYTDTLTRILIKLNAIDI